MEGADRRVEEIARKVQEQSGFVARLLESIGNVVVGQTDVVEGLLIGLLSDGHVLLEGVPGLAKTTLVKSLADSIEIAFNRIQFTPDLLPADLIGTMIYNPQEGSFKAKKGPVFTHILLADEINRAPAKVQSALLEAMQERQVTLGDSTHILEEPFLVLATQNPIEQEGTYPLPEAQVDRFMLKLKVGYPSKEEEGRIMDRMSHSPSPVARPVATPKQILDARKLVEEIYVDEKVKEYIVNLVFASREPKSYGLNLDQIISYGASPRASIYLLKAARARAFLQSKGYVSPDDVRAVCMNVLRHRILVSYEAEAEEITAEDVVRRILEQVEIP